MAKEDFCFTYYDGEAAIDKNHMSRLERGGYMDILLAQKRHGHLTINQIKQALHPDFDACFPSIEICLLKDQEGRYYIKWLDDSLKKHNLDRSDKNTWVYVVVLKNDIDEFIKIGISKNIDKRYSDYKRIGFSVKELFIKNFANRMEAGISESELHKMYSRFKYEPKNNFPGCTECFSLTLTETLTNG